MKDLTGLDGSHEEASNLTIHLVDESDFLFNYFVEHLYVWTFDFTIKSACDTITVAKLYAMVERFMADRFAAKLAHMFVWGHDSHNVKYSCGEIYDLLRIAYDSITKRNPENPIRECIFQFAASNLAALRLYSPFRSFLMDNPELSVEICLRVGGTFNTSAFKIRPK